MKNKIKRGFLLLVGLMACAHAVLAADHLAIVTQKGRAGVIDLQGRVFCPWNIKKSKWNKEKQMLSSLLKRMENTECMTDRARSIIAPTFKKVGPSAMECFAARDRGKDGHFYDRQGKALASHYDEVGPFSEALRL